MERSAKKQYNAIDVAKLIMALLVIVIHKPLFASEQGFENYFSRNIIGAVAVPFFFITSAFFFFGKLKGTKKDNKYFWDFEKRLFILYVVWSIIFLPINYMKFYGFSIDGVTLNNFIINTKTIIYRFIFSQTFIHLWYINTLMVSVAVLFLLRKKLSAKTTFVIIIAIFFIYRLFPLLFRAVPVMETVWKNIPGLLSNVFENGLLCTGFGMLLCDFDIKKKSTRYIFLAVSTVAMITFSVLIFDKESVVFETIKYVLVTICASAVFIVCRDANLKDSKVYFVLREYSSLIYFSHLLVTTEFLDWLAGITNICAFSQNGILKYSVTLLLSVVFSTIIILLSRNKKFKWLKYLY